MGGQGMTFDSPDGEEKFADFFGGLADQGLIHAGPSGERGPNGEPLYKSVIPEQPQQGLPVEKQAAPEEEEPWIDLGGGQQQQQGIGGSQRNKQSNFMRRMQRKYNLG